MKKGGNIKIDPNFNYGYIGAGLLKSSGNPNEVYRASLSFWAKNGDQNCIYTSGHLGEVGDVIWFEAEGTWYQLGRIMDKEDDPQTEIDWAVVDTSLLSSNGVNIKFEPTYTIENVLGYDVKFTDYLRDESDASDIENASNHSRLFAFYPKSGLISSIFSLGVNSIGEGATAFVYSLANSSAPSPIPGDSGGPIFLTEPNGENKIVGIHNGVSLLNPNEFFMTPIYEAGITDYVPFTIKIAQPISKGIVARTELVNNSSQRTWDLAYFGFDINDDSIDIYGIGKHDIDQGGGYNIWFPENHNVQIYFGAETNSTSSFLNVKREGNVLPSYEYFDKDNVKHILHNYVSREERQHWFWDYYGEPGEQQGEIWTRDGSIFKVIIDVEDRDDPNSLIKMQGWNSSINLDEHQDLIEGALVIWNGLYIYNNGTFYGGENKVLGIVGPKKEAKIYFVIENFNNHEWMIPYTKKSYEDFLKQYKKKKEN